MTRINSHTPVLGATESAENNTTLGVANLIRRKDIVAILLESAA